ncbi:MAG: acetyl-CoA carboxylase biotin carboxylase subunit [Microbacterium sp.]
MTFSRLLVANRGEIAVRIIRACTALGIETVLAVSDADRDTLGARLADRTVCIGPARSRDSYLSIPAILSAAAGTGAEAIHPGYGFLAENAEFAEACRDSGIVFVGPSPEAIRRMGDKISAREAARRIGVPLVPGVDGVSDPEQALQASAEIGLPVVLKASAGGGGKGIRVVRSLDRLADEYVSAAAEAEANFGDRALFLERFVTSARHIEVQVLGDRFGRVVSLGTRDCSTQRRYQKLIEEAPATGIPDRVRDAMERDAVALAAGIAYEGAGTIEFIYDVDAAEYYFLEMNTRIQVEHPVTEMVTGVDLVALQLRIAAGEPLPGDLFSGVPQGHAIECRIAAESPEHDFRPAPGRITAWHVPSEDGVRVDSHVYDGYVVPPYYDSLLGKVIVHGVDREDAIARMGHALERMRIDGVPTTAEYLRRIVVSEDFREQRVTTSWLSGRTV